MSECQHPRSQTYDDGTYSRCGACGDAWTDRVWPDGKGGYHGDFVPLIDGKPYTPNVPVEQRQDGLFHPRGAMTVDTQRDESVASIFAAASPTHDIAGRLTAHGKTQRIAELEAQLSALREAFMKRFPKDKDLRPGDVMMAVALGPPTPLAALPDIVERMRDQHASVAVERGQQGGCDLILMTVPQGRGQPFVDGLMQSIADDEGGEVIR